MKLRLWLLLISFIAFACDNVIVFKADKGCNGFEKVSVDQLISSPGRYHGKTIEVKGYYVHRPEVSVLSKDPASETESIWLTFNEDLINTVDGKQTKLSETKKLPTGYSMTVRGVIDMNDKGHLNKYALGIKACYISFSQKYRGLLYEFQESVFDGLAKPD